MAVIVLYFFLAFRWIGLWSVIVAFPGHTKGRLRCNNDSNCISIQYLGKRVTDQVISKLLDCFNDLNIILANDQSSDFRSK